MLDRFYEQDFEKTFMDALADHQYNTDYAPNISEGTISEERKNDQVFFFGQLKSSLYKLNPNIPSEAIEDALRKIIRNDSQDLVSNNKSFHRMLFNGVDVEFKDKGGRIRGEKVWIIDFDNPENNEFLALNQFTIKKDKRDNLPDRRPDIVIFVNGLPLIVVELKNPTDEKATILSAYKQIQTYKNEIPSLFRFNEIIIISDGIIAKAGTISSLYERFMPWKTVNFEPSEKNIPQYETLIEGMLNKKTFLDLIRHYIVYEEERDTVNNVTRTVKKLAAYHQYNAVEKAINTTVLAKGGSKKAGIVWHTQGSGKSLTMVFYASKLALKKELENPTIVVITDRNDLDGQLFATFTRCQELLRQEPRRADTRKDLYSLLKVASGGIVFTTIQKFLPESQGHEFPLLSERENIIVIADEAHRTQYGFGLKIPKNDDGALLKYGYAKYIRDALPKASFIGFTGTPIEKADRSTYAVFGKYVDVYDIQKSVEDKNTVRIYYENRLVEIRLKPEEVPKIDSEFDAATEGEETEGKEKQKTKWSTLEKVVGTEERISKIAEDFVKHWENRLNILDGKTMIVTMSRRIAVELHNEIIKLRPAWYHMDDSKGTIKVVMTGSASDGPEWQEHIRNKERRDRIGDRFKDPDDLLKVIIVRDMWLTGFDVPSLHTMYVDKPMQGHTLMQAIARVNRVFRDKPGGLVVDYIGIGLDLKKALHIYSDGDREDTGIPMDQAIALMQEKFEIVSALFHGYDYLKFFTADSKEKLRIILDASDFILSIERGKERFLENVLALSRAYALCVPSQESAILRDEIGFFQAVRAAILKNSEDSERDYNNTDSAIKQILSKSIVSDRVIDLFEAAGIQKPDISILSDQFLSEVKGMKQKNLAFEALKRLLADQIKLRLKNSVVQGRSFAELLDKTVKRYINRSIDAAQALEELIELAKKIREDQKRGEMLHLNVDEIAFYDALADYKNAKEIMGDETLKDIARELVLALKKNVKIDWTIRESVQAQMRLVVKRILRKYHYPPDGQVKATETVLEQAKLFAQEWAGL